MLKPLKHKWHHKEEGKEEEEAEEEAEDKEAHAAALRQGWGAYAAVLMATLEHHTASMPTATCVLPISAQWQGFL